MSNRVTFSFDPTEKTAKKRFFDTENLANYIGNRPVRGAVKGSKRIKQAFTSH